MIENGLEEKITSDLYIFLCVFIFQRVSVYVSEEAKTGKEFQTIREICNAIFNRIRIQFKSDG